MINIEVLVVDDEKDIYLSTKMALQLLAYEGIEVNVSYSSSSTEAIQMIHEKHYNLILLDIIMESIHAGYKVIDFINKNYKDKMIHIFVRSGQPGNVPDEFMNLIDSIDGYIHKTECTMEKLHNIVKSII